MKNFKFKSIFFLLTISTTLFFSCSSNKESDSKTETPVVTKTEESTKVDTLRITINGNDKMQYDLSEINATAGQTVVLTLHHTGTMPVAAMGHNFVLLTMGTSVNDFATLAIKAKDTEYIPADQKNVIAHTSLIGGGESTSVTFKAPEKGTYDFLCSFPGHHATMKGKFIVK